MNHCYISLTTFDSTAYADGTSQLTNTKPDSTALDPGGCQTYRKPVDGWCANEFDGTALNSIIEIRKYTPVEPEILKNFIMLS